jgi:endonuclease-3
MAGGTYTLLIELPEAATIAFGASGEVDLPAGWYAYTGSAIGSGGFSRIDRHRRIATGESDTRHWHVDYLLGHPGSRLADDVRSRGVDVECAVARRLADVLDPVGELGASDCDCVTHLAYCSDRRRLGDAVTRAHGMARH